MSKIKVGIVDDHEAIAQGISGELVKSGDYTVLFIVSDRNEVVKALNTELPGVLIMDVVMPGSQGIETFKEVLAAFPTQKILAYTALNSPMMIELLLRAGVKGYVSKNQPLTDLMDSVSDVYYDRISLPEDYKFISRKIKNHEGPEELSKREIEILILIAAEKKNTGNFRTAQHIGEYS